VGKLITKRQCGFNLVELLVVISLLGIVLALGYMFIIFGIRTYNRGERQSIAQQSIRQGTEFITSEIRYADEIIINPESKPEGYHYIYQNVNSSVIYRDTNNVERIILDSAVDKIVYSISFDGEAEGETLDYKLVILYSLEAEDDLYSLSTSVHIINLSDSDNYQDLSIVDEITTVIQYSKPWE